MVLSASFANSDFVALGVRQPSKPCGGCVMVDWAVVLRLQAHIAKRVEPDTSIEGEYVRVGLIPYQTDTPKSYEVGVQSIVLIGLQKHHNHPLGIWVV